MFYGFDVKYIAFTCNDVLLKKTHIVRRKKIQTTYVKEQKS